MDSHEPPSKRRKLSHSPEPEPESTSVRPDPSTSKPLATFAVEIVVGGEGGSTGQPSATSATAKHKQPGGNTTPKERLTERIDLNRGVSQLVEKQLSTWNDILNKKKKIIVIAGAGISVCAGIPDFRSSNGLFASVKSDYKLKASGKQLFDASVYRDDQSTSDFHDMVRNLHAMANVAEATAFHHLLASLAASGKLLRLYTQNVDCIETGLAPLATTTPLNGKGPWPKTIQLHGGLDKMNCTKCRAIKDFKPEIFVGPKPPDCPDCVDWEAARDASGKRSQGIGKLRPRMVLYNEHNPDEDAIGAVSTADLKARPDCLIVVGTSLKIPGVQRLVRELCASIRDFRGGKTVWINRDDPPATGQMKGLFDLIIKGDCETLAKFSNVKHHDQFTPDTDLKKITGTGMELGVSTPVSMDSESDSPLSSPVSYASSEEIWENMKNNRPVDIPWPPPKVVIPARPLSPSASPHPKKATMSKSEARPAKTPATPTKSKPAKRIKLKDGKDGKANKEITESAKMRKKPGPKPGWKKLKAQKEAESAQNGTLTKAFKAVKTQRAKVKKEAEPQPAAETLPPPLAMSTPPAAPRVKLKVSRVNMITLKRSADETWSVKRSPPADSSRIVLHGSDTSFSSLTDITSADVSSQSPSLLDPKRGMRIQDLLS
ncbi:hypothetical protein TWF106_008723 [Orbilia oligospora]|uniref:Deacetylase sirtuin-type domain-containing protein n=1 Tax=Orbilia oligospora TaxID=2813651 RepID=A0A6G1MGU1_ORBOL|nr:hypothetical protein TWF788_009236 [Orbilia oligospora]KAF3201551.1 hypothetical protein TWF679_011295 [Orbilia oligospora]KAF3215525.1 hypothetical protein TWF106_008723 [Orbilia oligospora]KAF3229930.1 hypothetical protein TWF191_000835 [Orbilia oligospora]KAF3257167.1 hypothetical protein TWF192_001443 [Orbilia oligospora]